MKFILIFKKDNFNTDMINKELLSSNYAPSLISHTYIKKEFSNFIIYLYLYDELIDERKNSFKFSKDCVDFYNGFIAFKNNENSLNRLFDAIENDEFIIGDYQAVHLDNSGNCFIKTPQSSLYPLFNYETDCFSVLTNELKLIVDGFNSFDDNFGNNFDVNFMSEYFHNGFFTKKKRSNYRTTIFKNISRVLPQDEIKFDEKCGFIIKENNEFHIPEKFLQWYKNDKDSLYDWYYEKLLEYADLFLDQIESNVSEIIVNLSGGFDSRLTLMVLEKLVKKHNINIKTETKGLSEHPDVIIAEEVASKLNVTWEHIEYINTCKLKVTPQTFKQYASTFFISQGDYDSHDFIEDYSRHVNNNNSFYQTGMDMYKREKYSSVINFNLWYSRRKLFASNFYFPLFATNFEFLFSRIFNTLYPNQENYKEFVYEILKRGGHPDLLEIPFSLNYLPQTGIPKFQPKGYTSTFHKTEPFLWDYDFVLNQLTPSLNQSFLTIDTKNNNVLSKNEINCLDYFILKKEIDKILKGKDIDNELSKLKNNTFYPQYRSYINLSAEEKNYFKKRSLMKLMDYACAASFNSFESLYKYLNNDNTDQIEELYKNIAELKNEKNNLKKELDAAKKQNKKLEKQLKKANNLNDEVLNSKSWKITKPLRKLKNIK